MNKPTFLVHLLANTHRLCVMLSINFRVRKPIRIKIREAVCRGLAEYLIRIFMMHEDSKTREGVILELDERGRKVQACWTSSKGMNKERYYYGQKLVRSTYAQDKLM